MSETLLNNPVEFTPSGHQAQDDLSHERLYFGALTSNDTIRSNEKHSLAVDAYHIGSLAIGSTLEAAQVTGQPFVPEFPSPYPSKDLKPFWGTNYDDFKISRVIPEQKRRSVALLEEKATTIAGLKTGEVEDFNHRATGGFEEAFNTRQTDENTEFTFNNLTIPEFLRTAKESDTTNTTWKAWLENGATQAQKENFAQWYTAEVTTLASPESRKAKIEEFKTDYQDRVKSAMTEGWIDGKHQRHLKKSIGKTKLNFFSPFSQTATEFGGANFESMLTKNSIILPIGAAKPVAVHELGHTFAGVDQLGIAKIMVGDRPAKDTPKGFEKSAAEFVYTALNEGFNEHMTTSLMNGSPEIINPKARAEAAAEDRTASELYTAYRELFGELVAGPEANGIITLSEIKQISSFMVERDMEGFSQFVSAKWSGRPVIKEMFQTMSDFFEARSVRQTGQGLAKLLISGLYDKPGESKAA